MYSLMNVVVSNRVRIDVPLFVIIWCQWINVHCQLNLYSTDRMIYNTSLQYDCLYYHIRDEKLAYQQLSNVIDEIIPYCFRPMNESEILLLTYPNLNDRNITFNHLRLSNITIQQLLSWSAAIDLVEQYQLYLDNLHPSLSNELFYNCTKPWFGHQCQYSFEFSDQMSIDQIVQIEFSRKVSSSILTTSLPCYVHIQCDRGGPFLCLDWREICDGHVDCLDGGLDEAFCFEMESNECNEHEYRCHNGLCIPEEFWEEGMGDAECLDRSDELADVAYLKSCYRDPRFRCEEHSCRPNWHEFSCGDGECVQKFDQCHNGRHRLLIESMAMQGNLTDQCWIVMLCLTMLVNGTSCQTWLRNDFIIEYLQTCNSIFQFPILPIHYGHIRLLYTQSSLKLNRTSFPLPDYICFDQTLCDCLTPTYFHENLTCLHQDEFQFHLSISGHPWIDLIFELNAYFSSCLIIHPLIDQTRLSNVKNSSLYSCQNSSKLISQVRLIDETKDCCMNDDEDYQFSCTLNDQQYRIQCSNHPNQCLSSLHSIDDCPEYENQSADQIIPFHSFCDGFEEYLFHDFNGQSYTDESECQYWPCNNMYSRCDGFWACSNGEDEDQCDDENHRCPLGTHPCLSPMNYSFSCLPAERVGDEMNDCLGASDELDFCRQLYPSKTYDERFRCANSDLCLPVGDLCDRIQSCPHGDDEHFCTKQRFVCEEDSLNNDSFIENVLCQLSEYKRSRLIHFSIRTSHDYPLSNSPMINQTIQRTDKHTSVRSIQSPMNSHSDSWFCHRGLLVRIRLDNDLHTYGCMCPPSYYGNHCQYQNERITLTLEFVSIEKQHVYAIVIRLIDQWEEIDSYDQFDYTSSQSCGIKFHRYLLYPTRPKNKSKMYRIRIDVFEKKTLTYYGSWHLSIPFLFLPVNKLVGRLVIPRDPNATLISSLCSRTCKNGECIQYINDEKSFCRCFTGWSGMECHIPIDCQRCSSDSICLPSTHNHSICVCPLTKFGPRCLLTSSCVLNACANHGQCIPADLSVPGSDYICLCSDPFFGARCEYVKGKLDVLLDNLDSPPYLLAFFLTISNQSEPISTIMLQKLTLFQRMVTFHISVPYHLVIIQSNGKFYLAVIQQTPKISISTSINPSRECPLIEEIFNTTLLKRSQYQRIKFYHLPCQTNHHLQCFLDETYLCLCTDDHHVNCVQFTRDQYRRLQCSSNDSCVNAGQCLQDHPRCPSKRICVCKECFFGQQCQFYAKGFGLTLDEILGYEIKHHIFLFDQSFPVQFTAGITMLMFIIGMINGVLSIITFRHPITQEVGCGMYLLTSSIASLLIVILFTLKFWFLILSYTNFVAHRWILYTNCMIIEPLLKVLLYIDNWLNACVAAERAFAVYRGISFRKKTSKSLAKWVIIILISINVILLIPPISHLHLFDDHQEERTWCVIRYSSSLDIYNSFIIFFHFFAPFLINFYSASYIIMTTARQRLTVQHGEIYWQQLKTKFKQHQHLFLSPIILILLSLPRLIISLTLNCQKSSKHFWLYLIGYFISFMPSVFVFVVFVLPSVIFKKAFRQAMDHRRQRQRAHLFKMNI